MTTYGFRSFCVFPHGVTSIYALFLGVSSSLLSLSSSWGCYLVQVDFVFWDNSPEQIEEEGTMTMGLLSYQNTDVNGEHICTSYSVEQIEEFDDFFRAARACSLVANIMLGTSGLLLICMSCLALRYSVVTALSAVVLLGGVFQGMTLLVFLSDFACEECRFHFGSGVALLGVAVSMAAGAVICHIPEIPNDDDDDQDISDRKHIGRPPTPRHIPHPRTKLSTTTGSSDDDDEEANELVIPKTWTVEDAQMVIVLPDGSKQIIEAFSGQKQSTACGATCSFLPECR